MLPNWRQARMRCADQLSNWIAIPFTSHRDGEVVSVCLESTSNPKCGPNLSVGRIGRPKLSRYPGIVDGNRKVHLMPAFVAEPIIHVVSVPCIPPYVVCPD